MSCSPDCDCNTDCYADDATTCSHGPILKQGANGILVATVCKAYTIDKGVGQVDVTKSGVTLTLPSNPEPGDQVAIAALVGAVSVSGGTCGDICGVDDDATITVPECKLGIFRFTSGCKWVTNIPAADD